ncbi:MAG: hypothetical protein ACTSP4_00710 [Candidatus Hodarchaeales archaeon]
MGWLSDALDSVEDTVKEGLSSFDDHLQQELNSDVTRGLASIATMGTSEVLYASKDRKKAEKIESANRAKTQAAATREAAADRAAIEASGQTQGLSLSDLYEEDDEDGLLSGINA